MHEKYFYAIFSNVTISLPGKTVRNGSLFGVVTISEPGSSDIRDAFLAVPVRFTTYTIPKSEQFNLLNSEVRIHVHACLTVLEGKNLYVTSYTFRNPTERHWRMGKLRPTSARISPSASWTNPSVFLARRFQATSRDSWSEWWLWAFTCITGNLATSFSIHSIFAISQNQNRRKQVLSNIVCEWIEVQDARPCGK